MKEINKNIAANIQNYLSIMQMDPQELARKLGCSQSTVASAPAPDPSEGISAELSRIDHQIGRFMDLYANDEISADLLKEKISGLNNKKIKLTEELRAVEIEKRTKLTPQKIRQIAGDFSDLVETGSISEIRSVLMTLIERIETDGKDVKIFWKF